jgi:hypothetical protein
MIVVYSFSALEDTLSEFCFALQRTAAPSDLVFNTSGSALESVKDYLKKTRMGFPSETAFWSAIKTAQKIRNMLTHSLGYLDAEPSTDEFIRRHIERAGRGSVERHARDQVQVNEEFISHLIGNMRQLCNVLCDRYLAAYKRCPPSPTSSS